MPDRRYARCSGAASRHDFVLLEESIEADDALRDVGHLAEHLEHHEGSGAFALREVYLAHAAAAHLLDAAVPTDDDAAESIALAEVRVVAPCRLDLLVLARGRGEHSLQRAVVYLPAVQPMQSGYR